MADKKISQLTELALADVADDDKLVIVDTGSTETKRVDVSNFRFLKKVGTAFIGGDQTGNTRGANVIDIQASRSAATKIAQHGKCITIGNDNIANTTNPSPAANVSCVAIGNSNTASTYTQNAVAIGNSNTASPTTQSVALGISNTCNGNYGTAVGNSNTANSNYGTAVGNNNNSGNGTAVGNSNTSGGYNPVALGTSNTANGSYFAIAIGQNNTSSGAYNCTTIGRNNTASGGSACTAIGVQNTVSNFGSTAVGSSITITSTNSHCFGKNIKTTVNSTLEIGHWNNTTTRSAAVRIHGGTGMVSMTLQDRSTEYTDGGATKGSEADNSLGREMYAIRRNGDSIILDVNIGGTVKNVTLGTAS